MGEGRLLNLGCATGHPSFVMSSSFTNQTLATSDIFITTTGNKGIIMKYDMAKMKNNAIVGNIGHFDNEMDMDGLMAATKRINIKPQVDKFVFPDGKGVIILAEGRLLNLGCATGHPSFVMSSSFTNQTLAQLELWKERKSGKYAKGKVYILPKILDEKVARLHLGNLQVGLSVLSEEQADYIGVPMNGPYKPEAYRYYTRRKARPRVRLSAASEAG